MKRSRGSWLTGLPLKTGWCTPGSARSSAPSSFAALFSGGRPRELRRHRLEVDAVPGVGRVGQPLVLELVEQERHALEAVAAVAVAGVGQEPDHRLVDLHPARRLRPVGRDRALRPLRRDRAGAVRDQQADEDLQRQRLFGRRLLAGHGEKAEIGHRPPAEALVARDAPERARAGGARRGSSRRPSPRRAAGTRAASPPSAARCACASAAPRRSSSRSPRGSRRATAGRPGSSRYRRNTDLPPRARSPPASPRGAGRPPRPRWRGTGRVAASIAMPRDIEALVAAVLQPRTGRRGRSASGCRPAPARPASARRSPPPPPSPRSARCRRRAPRRRRQGSGRRPGSPPPPPPRRASPGRSRWRSRAPAAARRSPPAARARGRAPSGRARSSPGSSRPSGARPSGPSSSGAQSPRRPARGASAICPA